MKTTDPTLQVPAEMAVTWETEHRSDIETFRLDDYLQEPEIEQFVSAIRDAIAAPVLALHQPLRISATGRVCGTCRATSYPCPTVRALGVAG